MALTVELLLFDDLSEHDQGKVSNNGPGKEISQYLLIKHNEKRLMLASSGMEPKDVTFSRGLSWVADIIQAAYKLGRADKLTEMVAKVESNLKKVDKNKQSIYKEASVILPILP